MLPVYLGVSAQVGKESAVAGIGFNLRVRKIRVTIRIQTPNAVLRGTDPLLFLNPGSAKSGQRFVPDLITRFEVSPRNVNLTR